MSQFDITLGLAKAPEKPRADETVLNDESTVDLMLGQSQAGLVPVVMKDV